MPLCGASTCVTRVLCCTGAPAAEIPPLARLGQRLAAAPDIQACSIFYSRPREWLSCDQSAACRLPRLILGGAERLPPTMRLNVLSSSAHLWQLIAESGEYTRWYAPDLGGEGIYGCK